MTTFVPATPMAPEPPDAAAYRGRPTDDLAMYAMGASIAGVLFGPVLAIAGIVLGALSLGRIRARGLEGRPLAVGAIVLGGVSLLATVGATVVGVTIAVEVVEAIIEQLPPLTMR